MFTRFAALARNFLQAKEGAVAIQMALMMPVLIGMGALAIDIGFALYKQRQMQSAADAAAFSAAIAKSTGHPATFSTEAYAVAGRSASSTAPMASRSPSTTRRLARRPALLTPPTPPRSR